MITYKVGDLLDVTDGILAHGCNMRGVMGSGVARLVQAKYPEAFRQYITDLCNYFPLGGVSFWSPLGEDEPTRFLVANCLTQEKMGADGKKYVSYDAVDMSFQILNKVAEEGSYTIHIPRIGAGLGGGDWGVIEAIINHKCKNVDVIVWDLP